MLGHGVDGEVATREVLFEGDLGAGKSPPLRSGKGVLFRGLGMKKDWKVPAYSLKASRLQFVARAAHDHPVSVLYGQAQQTIANRTTDEVGGEG
tara:strand:- start:132 stop:413 length:282 start_codon:yes stop_codon:yes gene_type:complete